MQKSKILLLKGPSGCGKTATLKALAQDLDLEVQEWSDKIESRKFLSAEDRSDFDDFAQPFLVDDTIPYESQAKVFRNFMLRANRYKVLDGLNQRAKKRGKIVLLEELPSMARRNSKEFKHILEQYQFSKQSFPLVIVISEGPRDDVVKSILPEELINRLNIDVISFNPANSTNLVKCLKIIALAESSSGIKRFPVPDKDTLTSIAESSNGDIRGAINALQFACTNGGSNMVGSVAGTSITSSSKKTKSTKNSKKQPSDSKGLAKIGGKDSSLDLFHAIGKVLYCKREEGAKNSRGKLLSNPEEILQAAPMTPDSFTCFLHQSYLDFFTNMDDLAAAADHYSLADSFFNEWTVKIFLQLKFALSVRLKFYF